MGMLLVTSSITVYGATEENEVQQPRAAQLYCTGEVAKTVYGKNTIQIYCYTGWKDGISFNPRIFISCMLDKEYCFRINCK